MKKISDSPRDVQHPPTVVPSGAPSSGPVTRDGSPASAGAPAAAQRYVARLVRSNAGRDGYTREYWEIVEVGPRGGVIRTVARTPLVTVKPGQGMRQDRLDAAKDARKIADALNLGEV